DGLTWAEQSQALANALIENQSLSFLNPDAEGKTDAVSGVSISVNGFISLAQQCIDQAAGIEHPESMEAADAEEAEGAEAADTDASQNGTQVDGISGATRSSTAAVTAINEAYNFLQTVK
ncbi:MAG TPA: FMN-binding protein, partial [Candidatus Merdisoma merdipullorum]|nr:FMN-binding protein [Candidatus Merdisoma merdipullorum]